MTDYKTWLGVLAATLQIVSYSIYFRAIYKGKTKPHAFTWFVWGVISIIGFAAIVSSNGGAGTWIIGVNAILCLTVAYIGYRQGLVKYDKFDRLALIGGIFGAVLWGITKQPFLAVVLVALSDAIGFVPTFRKAYRLPFDENALSFSLGIIDYGITIFALRSLTLTTWLYPAEIVVVDAALVTLIIYRRRKLSK